MLPTGILSSKYSRAPRIGYGGPGCEEGDVQLREVRQLGLPLLDRARLLLREQPEPDLG
jgi:hypothetical protein